MLPIDRNTYLYRERYSDLLREAESRRLVKMARNQQPVNQPVYLSMARWLSKKIQLSVASFLEKSRLLNMRRALRQATHEERCCAVTGISC